MGFPHPEVFLHASPPRSNRRRQRFWRTRKVKLLHNMIVAQWSWLAIGCPPRGMSGGNLCAPLTMSQ
eukprot:5299402-Amphidinium_carterae.1